MKKLVRGTRGWAVRWLQQALNKRARARGLPTITVDGVLGTETLMSVQRVGRALGALEATLAQAHPKRGDKAAVTIGLQRIIRWPATRNPAQLRRARDRKAAAERRRASGAAAAIAWATRWIGRTEDQIGRAHV